MCYVYTGDTDAAPQQIIENVFQRFNIQFEKKPIFIYLKTRKVVEAKYYPFLTILMQSLGSVILAAEALLKFRPHIYIDTMGYAFTYPFFRYFGGCTVVSYTHYPTISSDMLKTVSNRIEAHNNRVFISQSAFLSSLKLFYYHIFAFLYGLVGSCADVVMVNSSWTKGHISSLWKFGPRPQTVFPPCDTLKFSKMPFIDSEEKEIKSIVSIGQFRPEKNYPLQLKSFYLLLQKVSPKLREKLRLVLIGGLRNEEDKKRVASLKSLALDLGIENKVIWKVNATFSELLKQVQQGTMGLHSMWNEHFGIGIVESMAGGLIMVAHDSGGPQMDIIVPFQGQKTGFLASTQESYASKMYEILSLSNEERLAIQRAARASTERFSETVFRNTFISFIDPFLSVHRTN